MSYRQFVLVVIVGVVWLSTGCGSPYHHPPANLTLRPDLAGQLHVLHVSSDRYDGSGYAARNGLVVSAAHLFKHARPVGEVDGNASNLFTMPDRKNLDRNALAPVDDWVVLFTLDEDVQSNRIDPDYRPRRGERVYFGGFLLGDVRSITREKFLEMDPVIVEGESLGGPAAASGRYKGLWLIAAPPGSYAGFSGGPAACMDAEGTLHVWGTLVRGGLYLDGLVPRMAVAIAPLPPEFLTTLWQPYPQ